MNEPLKNQQHAYLEIIDGQVQIIESFVQGGNLFGEKDILDQELVVTGPIFGGFSAWETSQLDEKLVKFSISRGSREKVKEDYPDSLKDSIGTVYFILDNEGALQVQDEDGMPAISMALNIKLDDRQFDGILEQAKLSLITNTPLQLRARLEGNDIKKGPPSGNHPGQELELHEVAMDRSVRVCIINLNIRLVPYVNKS